MTVATATKAMNTWGRQGIPFLFIIDFRVEAPLVYRLDNVPDDIAFDFSGTFSGNGFASTLETSPISLTDYERMFDQVKQHLNYGNSYLLNLTAATKIHSPVDLEEVFRVARARYKLLVKDRFVVFSPETFVTIENGYIRSYPMKGTIRASVPDAANKILRDPKEMAEHATIVDLIRNDLAMVSSHIRVTRFRYVEKVQTNREDILQVSSEITGELPENYLHHLGDIIFTLLPAGSISGAPKPKTIEIIREVESQDRGYFSGVCGVFDGRRLESAVMIRFIEKTSGGFVYKSGGGITSQSDLELEYQELLDKVYVPVY